MPAGNLPRRSLPQASHDDDLDSTLGDDTGSEADYCSVTDSVYDFPVENGRTYHAYMDGKYLLPNDERERERMELVNDAINLIFEGKPFFAPVRNPHKIVDMGTGTGAWAIDVGDQFPEAHVVGIDLSPIQPKWVAPNVEFRVDDIDQPWAFSRSISLIHSRLMSGHSIRNWPSYFRKCYAHLSPGGWVEAQEVTLTPRCASSGPFLSDSYILEWHKIFHHGMRRAGYDLNVSADDIAAAMEDAGFINVHVQRKIMPLGPWCPERHLREAGRLVSESLNHGIGGISVAVFTRILGWQVIDLELFLRNVRREIRSRSLHAFWPFCVIYGQKPQ